MMQSVRRLKDCQNILAWMLILVNALLNANVTKENINEYGRFDALKASVIKEDAQEYFACTEGEKMPMI